MSLQDLPEITGRLAIQPIANGIEDGFGLVRTDTDPSVEVAIIHDGADRGIGEAEEYARLLSLSPIMLTLLREALGAWAMQFDGPNGASDADLYVSGADLLEWLAGWRMRVRQKLRAET